MADAGRGKVFIERAVEAVKPYFTPNSLATFGLGMSSGFPLTFVISLLGFWLSFSDVSKGDVGLFALVTIFYTVKFLWSPAIDRLSLGPITRRFGQRRGWLYSLQALLALSIILVSRFDPATELYSVAVLVAIIAFLSASQDIVIDAYRIEIIDDNEQGYSAASYVYGYRTANFLSGVVVLTLADFFGWPIAILSLLIMLVPGFLAAYFIGEPKKRAQDKYVEDESQGLELSSFVLKVREVVYLPFKEFTRREHWLLILLFVFLLKVGDGVAAIMTAPLIVDMKFTAIDVASANKVVGFITLMLGVGIGAAFYKQIGVYRALLFSAIFMMLTNLGFAWLWLGEAEWWRLAVTIGFENFATGLGTTVTIAYFASLCNVNFTATQYALLSSLGNLARTFLGAPSGYVADNVGWTTFFIITTLLALPGIILLVILNRKTGGMEGGKDKAG